MCSFPWKIKYVREIRVTVLSGVFKVHYVCLLLFCVWDPRLMVRTVSAIFHNFCLVYIICIFIEYSVFSIYVCNNSFNTFYLQVSCFETQVP